MSSESKPGRPRGDAKGEGGLPADAGPRPEAPIDDGHDTEVDEPPIRKVRLRTRTPPKDSEPVADEEPRSSRGGAMPPPKGPPPTDTLDPASLARVRLKEAIVRRHHEAARPVDAPPARETDPDPWAPRFAWVRTDDETLETKLSADGAALVARRASGQTAKGRPSSLSAGVDGRLIRLTLNEGMSAKDVLVALGARLSSVYRLDITLESPERGAGRLQRL